MSLCLIDAPIKPSVDEDNLNIKGHLGRGHHRCHHYHDFSIESNALCGRHSHHGHGGHRNHSKCLLDSNDLALEHPCHDHDHVHGHGHGHRGGHGPRGYGQGPHKNFGLGSRSGSRSRSCSHSHSRHHGHHECHGNLLSPKHHQSLAISFTSDNSNSEGNSETEIVKLQEMKNCDDDGFAGRHHFGHRGGRGRGMKFENKFGRKHCDDKNEHGKHGFHRFHGPHEIHE